MDTVLQDSPQAIRQAILALRGGNVIAAPTETVYGLMALWQSDSARQEIYRLKHRPADKRLQMLAPDVETAIRAGLKPNDMLQKIANAFRRGSAKG